ncbi:MAG: GIY-YIG nuclease family protein [Pedobacter sp.]|nr:GIY-YIG nuclease family protein [Pedobacter sp.]MDQ8051793.1 GIY-YIG nuclease family protein [Pedobacter sp.]
MALFHNYYVYILRCSDESYYTGLTNNLERRLKEHASGENIKSYTYQRRPIKLMYVGHFVDINTAIAFEKQVKGWSRKKKEALFEENWTEIVRLSNLKQSSTRSN